MGDLFLVVQRGVFGVSDSGAQCPAECRKAGVDPVPTPSPLSLRCPPWIHPGAERNTSRTRAFCKELVVRPSCPVSASQLVRSGAGDAGVGAPGGRKLCDPTASQTRGEPHTPVASR